MPKLPTRQHVPVKPPLVAKRMAPVSVDLVGEKVHLKTLTPQMVTPAIARWLTDPAIMEGLNTPKQSMGLEVFRTFVESFDQVKRNLMLVLERPEDRPVGFVLLEIDLRHKTGSLHFVIGSAADRGRSLAYWASGLAVFHAFTERQIEKMTFQPLERNEAAIAACEKNGLRLEGILRSHRIDGRTGERLDQRIYGLTAEEFRQRLADHLQKGGARPR